MIRFILFLIVWKYVNKVISGLLTRAFFFFFSYYPIQDRDPLWGLPHFQQENSVLKNFTGSIMTIFAFLAHHIGKTMVMVELLYHKLSLHCGKKKQKQPQITQSDSKMFLNVKRYHSKMFCLALLGYKPQLVFTCTVIRRGFWTLDFNTETFCVKVIEAYNAQTNSKYNWLAAAIISVSHSNLPRKPKPSPGWFTSTQQTLMPLIRQRPSDAEEI